MRPSSKGNEPRGFVGDRKIVGYQDDRLTRGIEAVKGIDDDMTVGGIEIAGGLVGEYDFRRHKQRPCDRHPLLLTARQLRGHPLGQSSQAELIQQIALRGGAVRTQSHPPTKLEASHSRQQIIRPAG